MHFRSNYETRSNYWNQQEKQDEEKKTILKENKCINTLTPEPIKW